MNEPKRSSQLHFDVCRNHAGGVDITVSRATEDGKPRARTIMPFATAANAQHIRDTFIGFLVTQVKMPLESAQHMYEQGVKDRIFRTLGIR